MTPAPQATACLCSQVFYRQDGSGMWVCFPRCSALFTPPGHLPALFVPPPYFGRPSLRYDLIFLSRSPIQSFGPMSTTGASSTQYFPSSNTPSPYPQSLAQKPLGLKDVLLLHTLPPSVINDKAMLWATSHLNFTSHCVWTSSQRQESS